MLFYFYFIHTMVKIYCIVENPSLPRRRWRRAPPPPKQKTPGRFLYIFSSKNSLVKILQEKFIVKLNIFVEIFNFVFPL